MRMAVAWLAVLAAVGTGALLQPADAVLEPDPALAPAAKFVGRWEGTGWRVGRDGARSEYRAVERARWNLAKTAILVEGLGTSVDPGTGETVVGHDAFGYVRHNAASGAIEFHAIRGDGSFAMHELTTNDDGTMQWEMSAGPGKVRFTVDISEREWKEKGEFSQDGETWQEFLGVSLKRVE